MSTPNDHDIRILNGLIETTLDSAEGYREAAEETTDPHYRTLFERRADERRLAVEELQAAVRSLGGDPGARGSILAKAHRAFLDLKHALLRDDDSVVGTVESGEQFITGKFERALHDGDISATTRETVRRAYERVKAGHDQMLELKRSLESQRAASSPLFPQ